MKTLFKLLFIVFLMSGISNCKPDEQAKPFTGCMECSQCKRTTFSNKNTLIQTVYFQLCDSVLNANNGKLIEYDSSGFHISIKIECQ